MVQKRLEVPEIETSRVNHVGGGDAFVRPRATRASPARHGRILANPKPDAAPHPLQG
jgi:hypothetical protein